MSSEAAEAVAIDVLKKVRIGQIPNKGKIIKKHGYSKTVSKSPTKVTKTKSYLKIILPYAQRLQKHQEKILKAMEAKDLSDEDYKVLSDSLTKVTHDVQLLTGGSTDNVAVGVKLLKDDELESIANGS